MAPGALPTLIVFSAVPVVVVITVTVPEPSLAT
jgi:hypothetical protein